MSNGVEIKLFYLNNKCKNKYAEIQTAANFSQAIQLACIERYQYCSTFAIFHALRYAALVISTSLSQLSRDGSSVGW